MRQIQRRMVSEYKRIAEENGITPELVMEIEAFQWKFVKDNIAKGRDDADTFENIYLRYLGTFHLSSAILEYVKRNKNKVKRKDVESNSSAGDS